MTDEETVDARGLDPSLAATAMADPGHLKAWLRASDREYLVLHAPSLVDALPWPQGVQALMQILEAYRSHRMAQSPVTRDREGRDVHRDDRLTPAESEEAVSQIRRHQAALEREWGRDD